MNPEVADTVIVTDPKLDAAYGKRYLVTELMTTFVCGNIFESLLAYILVTGIEDQIENLRLTADQYQVLEKDGVRVEINDRIVCTNRYRELAYCNVFFVVHIYECQEIMIDNGLMMACGAYRILKRSPKTPSSSCSDCKGTGEILLLTSTVKCGCMTKKG